MDVLTLLGQKEVELNVTRQAHRDLRENFANLLKVTDQICKGEIAPSRVTIDHEALRIDVANAEPKLAE